MSKLLVLVDFQNDFINGSLGTKEAESIIPNVMNKIKEHDGPIMVTMDTHHGDYFNTIEGKCLPIEHCQKGTLGWELQPDVKELLKEKHINAIIEKNQFSSKELFAYFIDCKYDEIEFIGLCTDICVMANAVIARTANLNRQIIVDASCCAGVTPLKHQAALEILKSLQVKVINE